MEAIGQFFQSINPWGDAGAVGTFWAIVPPIIAIALALITKEVYLSLFVGIAVGALLYSPAKIFETIFGIMGDSVGGNINICIFLVFLGIIVALVTKSGASRAYGNWAARAIKSKRGALFATSGLGVLIFVDDYFNCLTVGTVMSPVTDRHKVSRAKLAYIIDATAAPVCIIAPISSWAAAVSSTMATDPSVDGFGLFMRTIPFNFYALLTIIMVVLMIALNFDFGPMKKAELAQNPPLKVIDDAADAEKKPKGKVIDLILPIAVLIITCIAAMLYTGGIFDKSRSFTADAGSNIVVSDDAEISVYISDPEQGEQTSPGTFGSIKELFPDGIEIGEPLELGSFSSEYLEDGKVASEDGATVTLPDGYEIISTDAYVNALIGYYESMGYTGVTKVQLGITDDTVVSVTLSGEAEATLAKSSAVTVGKADISTWELLYSSFGDCDSSLSLVLGSIITLIFIFILYMSRRILTYKQFTDSIVDGFKAMVPAIAILALAWTLGGICNNGYLNAGQFVKNIVETYSIPISILPAIFFLIATGLAFATGTSWGTFGILIPIIFTVLNGTIDFSSDSGASQLAFVISAVLAGAVCGDHISPISDTTILSSTGARCNHLEHVSTQIPYAMVVAGSCLVGYIVGGVLDNGYIGLAVGAGILIIVIMILYMFNRNRQPVPATADGAPCCCGCAECSEEAQASSDTAETEAAVAGTEETQAQPDTAEAAAETVEETVGETVEVAVEDEGK